MTREELTAELLAQFPDLVEEAGGEWLNLFSTPENWKKTAIFLRYHPTLLFDYLFCLTCVDWKTHLTMVYHFTSTTYRHTLVMKVKLDRNTPVVETVCDIWKTAEFHEREVFELFGVQFANHPDLRKLILPDDWVGFPLRKDYEDAVNMIKL